jgi:putative cardiolipin synthase
MPALRAQVGLDAATHKGEAYAEAVRTTSLVQKLIAGELPLEWTQTRLVYDDPAKGLGARDDDVLMLSRLSATLGAPTSIFDVVSPYFVPGRDGEPFLSGLSRAGVTVRVLTNSAEANDVPIVHAGYAKYRKDLLAAGVDIVELASGTDVDNRPKNFLGASSASLHAKTIAVDRERIFIGSLNLDPRSLYLNCEMGLVVDSPAMAGAVSDVFERDFTAGAYRPALDPDGHLYWLENRDGETVRHDVEPNTNTMQRFLTIILGWLPIEWLL